MEEIYAKIQDRQGGFVEVRTYRREKDLVLGLFKEGYPDSFDEYDLEFVKEFLEKWEEKDLDHGCLLAIREEEIVGACLFEKIAGPQDQWETSYIFVKARFRGSGIGRILVGVQEEYLKNKARVLFAINAGILPKEVISYPFWQAAGYALWGILPGYFRDDLSGIFLVKRNPYYRIGRGIPKDSGWQADLADSLTGERISRKKYQEILYILNLTPKEKWGIALIGKKNVLVLKV